MASEQYSGGMQAEEENTKPSFMNKVKSKAKKLKSKLKPRDSENSSGQDPSPRDPLDQYTTGVADQDGHESENSSEPEEEGNVNQHASEDSPFGAVSSGQTGYELDSKTDDKAFSADPAISKSDGPPGTRQAVPTNYSYFNADPEQTTFPSDTDASGRQQGVPSAVGGLFGGLTPATQNSSVGTASPFAKSDNTLSKSGDRDFELPVSSLSPENSAERNNVGLVEPSQSSQDSLLSHPIEQDQGVSERDNQGYGSVAATAAGVGGLAAGVGHKIQKSLSNDSTKKVHSGMRSTSDPEAHDKSYAESKGEGFAPDTAGIAAGAKHSMDTNANAPSQELTWTQKIYNSVVGAKDTVASHPVTQSVVSHPVTQQATETAYGLKNTAASKLGYADQAISSDSTPVSEKATDSAVQVKNSAASNLPANDEQKPFTDRVTESAYGVKDAVVSHPITQSAASKLGYADQALSTDSSPVSQKATDSAVQVKNSAASNLSANDEQKPFTDRVTESAYGIKDAVVSHPITQSAASKLGYADQALPTNSSPVSQKITDSAYQVKDSAASNLSANDGVQKSPLDRLTGSAYGLKDTVASHPITKKAYEWKDTVVSHPITQKTTDYAVQGKNYAANQLSYADQALSSDETPISAKARDAALQKTTPDHHDKALAESVTDSISSLPALLTSKLGLNAGTTGNSPTTASTTPTADVSTFDPSSKETSFPDHSAAASPGIMDRVSGLASSLFGGVAKQPSTHTDTERPTSVE